MSSIFSLQTYVFCDKTVVIYSLFYYSPLCSLFHYDILIKGFKEYWASKCITETGGVIIKTVAHLNTDLFSDTEKYVSIGRIRTDIIASVVKHFPEFAEKLSPDIDILLWVDRIKHIERHRKDFSSSEEYERCFHHIPDIINNPDYVSIHPNKDSISFIKKFDDHTSVAVRISSDGRLAFRTMYPLRETQLDNYIKNGYAWKL